MPRFEIKSDFQPDLGTAEFRPIFKLNRKLLSLAISQTDCLGSVVNHKVLVVFQAEGLIYFNLMRSFRLVNHIPLSR